MTIDSSAYHGPLYRYGLVAANLILVLVAASWVSVVRRANDDDVRAVRDAEVIQANIAQAVANHTEQMIEWIRLFNAILVNAPAPETAYSVINSTLGRSGAFLRLMQFDEKGHLLMSIGKAPEPWLRQAAMSFAISVSDDFRADCLRRGACRRRSACVDDAGILSAAVGAEFRAGVPCRLGPQRAVPAGFWQHRSR